MKRCVAAIDKAHLSIYTDLQIIKSAKKVLIDDYLHKVIFFISWLQDKSSEVIKLNIKGNSMNTYSSNVTAISDVSSFSTNYSTSSDSNPTNNKMG